MEPCIDACMLKIIKRLSQAAERDESIDLGLFIWVFVMDVFGKLAFSNPLRVFLKAVTGIKCRLYDSMSLWLSCQNMCHRLCIN